jgi:hypothetical protein
VPSVGVNAEGLGEAYRLNLEVGRFMRSYEIDVGGDDTTMAQSQKIATTCLLSEPHWAQSNFGIHDHGTELAYSQRRKTLLKGEQKSAP